jgi:hypothetical protein
LSKISEEASTVDRADTQKPPLGQMPGRRLAVLSGIAVLSCTLLIVFGSTLFQTLGFEYSSISALILSLLCGLDGALAQRPATFAGGLWKATLRGLLLALAPLAVSILSLVWIDNCALQDGLILYAEITVVTALLAEGFGFGFRVLLGRRFAVATFLLFWILTLVLALLPGYTNAQIFAYGWQFGYFPGFIWDRAIDLRPAYLSFRIENVLWLALLLAIGYDLFYGGHDRVRFVLASILLLGVVLLIGSHDFLGITTSQSQVRESLQREAYLGSRTWAYYQAGDLTDQEIHDLQHDVPIFLAAIRDAYELRDESEPIHIYIYPDAATMEQLVGTRAASIAKPWLGEVHIMKASLRSLKHELTHVVLRTIGNFPFYASWSTGLTEGAAVALEAPEGAMYTTDELSSQLLTAQMTSGVKGIMQFTGFASENSHKSYTLAGSFVRYLLHHYGARKFREVYGSLNYEHVYGKSLDVLESEWKHSLIEYQQSLLPSDLVRLTYLFGGASIINTPCVRKLGKLEHAALVAYEQENFGDAYRASFAAYKEGGSPSDAWETAEALVMLGRLGEARALLDTATIPNKDLVLGLGIGDLDWIAGDTVNAESKFEYVLGQHLGTTSFITAYDRLQLLGTPEAPEFRKYLSLAYHTSKPDYKRSLAIVDSMLAHHRMLSRFDRTYMILLYLKLRNLEEMGWPEVAAKYDPITAIHVSTGDVITDDDSLALSVVERHMWRYRAPSWAKTYTPARYRRAAGEELYEMQSVLRRQYRGDAH